MTDDGYILQMAHVTSDASGDPGPNAGFKGPLLLIHDNWTDARSYLYNNSEEDENLVVQLYDEGWDVYLANMRGTKYGRTHTTFYADGRGANGAADFWDFDMFDRATKDVPAMINTILDRRFEANGSCNKVHIIDSAATSLLTAATFPTTAS